MDTEERQKNLRKKLDLLGFRQPLPVSGVGLVSALLEDLLKTTDSLKVAKKEINQLLQEKSAWELGAEPYKCDNSKLLKECNKLNSDLIRQHDNFEIKRAEFLRKIRTLELDKRYLEEQCKELGGRVRELEVKFVPKGDVKHHKDGMNLIRKPFVSTVRSGLLPSMPEGEKGPYRVCSVCPNARSCNGNRLEMEKIQNDVQNRDDCIQVLKKQIESRDREIERLGSLLSGGRPVTTLARDCCFRGVGSMAEDVEILQKQKCDLKKELNEALVAQHEAMQRAMRLAERNSILEQDYSELEKTALDLETKANRMACDKDHENSDLKRRISDLMSTIEVLRADAERLEMNEISGSVREKLVQALKKEKTLQMTIEKLQKKVTKLKAKLSEAKSSDDMSARDSSQVRREETESLRKEIATLQDKVRSNSEVKELKLKLSEKELEIRNLHHELNQLRRDKMSNLGEICSARSLGQSSATLRQERERELMRGDLEKAKIERDALRDRLKMATEAQLEEQRRYEGLLQDINGRIGRLEAEKAELLSAQGPTQITVTLLKEELKEVRDRLKDLQNENNALRSTNSHLKILNEQTEKVLVQNHNKLIHSEAQLGETSSKLSTLDATKEQLRQELDCARGQISQLRANEIQLQNEKDSVVIELDQKTEKAFHLEQEIKRLKMDKRDLEVVLDQLKRRLDEMRNDSHEREKQYQDVACETGTLRSQIGTLKRNADTARSENGRLVTELTDCQSELKLTRQKLKETQKEVDGLRLQLQQYVQEVERAENLLAKKELEREEMLDHFKSLSQDTIMLEGNNQALEMMTAETKKALTESEDRVSALLSQLKLRESEIEEFEKQVTVLSSQVAVLEGDLEDCKDDKNKLKSDLDAMRELCSKLDHQKDKFMEEVQELTSIRADLEKELERLRSQLGRSIVNEGATESAKDFEQQTLLIANLNQEVSHLRGKVAQLEMELKEEHRVCVRNENLAMEYKTQLQEAQQKLTDERYERTKMQEDTESVSSGRRKRKCLRFHCTVRGKNFLVRKPSKGVKMRRKRIYAKSSKNPSESSKSIFSDDTLICWDDTFPSTMLPSGIDVFHEISLHDVQEDETEDKALD
ncbi:centrosomal protein of 135 kDa-like isoform X1 [Lutzomyia longipalpis]|uniref:centrosomal protein of 135 kDa-like isoform X1 n=1 Tax=Lutzomyia longipalpis TaxID=7200 RepID=UPI0024841E6D|nr:centrosomal protein of 135 kDa-like isoform X1 [Lutzomyia longipalpis]